MEKLLVRNWTIGADIECFIKDKDTNKIISAEPYIKGTKDKPFNFDVSDKFFATSLDNVLSEWCIPPATDKDCFVNNINRGINYINSLLPSNLCTTHIPSAVLDEAFLLTKQAQVFGCEPDYNVWLRMENERPIAENKCLRSSGFHVHVGFENGGNDIETTEKLVKAMDLFLSVPSILLEPNNERRKLYGKAGAFRFKPYGFEHRVLSGYFASSDGLKSWVFNNTQKAIEFVNGGNSEEIEARADIIQNTINTSNKVLAGNLIREFNIEMN